MTLILIRVLPTKTVLAMFRPLLVQINKIFCISLHFSGKQCSTSSLTFEAEQVEVWKSISFQEKEITATAAYLDYTNNPPPIFVRLKLNKEKLTLCPENFRIIGYTQVSGFVSVPKYLEATIHSVKWETVMLQKSKQNIQNDFVLNINVFLIQHS
jgi:hypothetical protein